MLSLKHIPRPLLYFLVGIIIMYVLFNLKNRSWIQTSADKLLDTQIKILVRQIGRWSLAAEKEHSPFIAVLHANYAMGYFMALLNLASKNQIEKATNINFDRFKKNLTDIQYDVSKLAMKRCPNFSSDNSYLSVLSDIKIE